MGKNERMCSAGSRVRGAAGGAGSTCAVRSAVCCACICCCACSSCSCILSRSSACLAMSCCCAIELDASRSLGLGLFSIHPYPGVTATGSSSTVASSVSSRVPTSGHAISMPTLFAQAANSSGSVISLPCSCMSISSPARDTSGVATSPGFLVPVSLSLVSLRQYEIVCFFKSIFGSMRSAAWLTVKAISSVFVGAPSLPLDG